MDDWDKEEMVPQIFTPPTQTAKKKKKSKKSGNLSPNTPYPPPSPPKTKGLLKKAKPPNKYPTEDDVNPQSPTKPGGGSPVKCADDKVTE